MPLTDYIYSRRSLDIGRIPPLCHTNADNFQFHQEYGNTSKIQKLKERTFQQRQDSILYRDFPSALHRICQIRGLKVDEKGSAGVLKRALLWN